MLFLHFNSLILTYSNIISFFNITQAVILSPKTKVIYYKYYIYIWKYNVKNKLVNWKVRTRLKEIIINVHNIIKIKNKLSNLYVFSLFISINKYITFLNYTPKLI